MERKKSKKGGKKEGGEDGKSRGKRKYGLQRERRCAECCGRAGPCVCLIVPIAFLRLTGRSWGSFSRVLSFCFFLCYTSIFSNGDLNFLWLSLFVFILLRFSVCIEHFN